MAESLTTSSKPRKALLTVIPAGGTRPTRDPIGKIGSAGRAAGGKIRKHKKKAGGGAAKGRRPDGIEFTTVGHAKPVLEPAGAAIAAAKLFTRRMVRLIRPRCGSKVDVPGSMRSTP